MKALFLPGSTIDSRLLAAIFALILVLFLGLGGLVAACGTETAGTVASTTLTASAVTATLPAETTTQSVITLPLRTVLPPPRRRSNYGRIWASRMSTGPTGRPV